MKCVRRMFGKWFPKKIDQKERVKRLISNLPPHSSPVAILSPRYDDKHYSCEVIMEPPDLLRWVERKEDDYRDSDDILDMAIIEALKFWLKTDNYKKGNHIYITHGMVSECLELESFKTELIEDYNAKIYCIKCGCFVDDVVMEEKDESGPIGGTGWHYWTDEWTCPEGHQLYLEKHELHALYVKRDQISSSE